MRSQALAAQRSRRQAHQQDLLNRLMSVKVPGVPATVKDPLPGMTAPVAADPANGVIYSDGPMDRHTAAHESAHLLERLMTDRDKARFARVMGLGGHPWEVGQSGAMGTGPSTGYRNSVGEIMADWTAMLATRHDPRSNRVVAGYIDTKDMPNRRQLLQFGRALERFGARNGLQQYVRPRRA